MTVLMPVLNMDRDEAQMMGLVSRLSSETGEHVGSLTKAAQVSKEAAGYRVTLKEQVCENCRHYQQGQCDLVAGPVGKGASQRGWPVVCNYWEPQDGSHSQAKLDSGPGTGLEATDRGAGSGLGKSGAEGLHEGGRPIADGTVGEVEGVYYHGSPRTDLTKLRRGSYVTPDRATAELMGRYHPETGLPWSDAGLAKPHDFGQQPEFKAGREPTGRATIYRVLAKLKQLDLLDNPYEHRTRTALPAAKQAGSLMLSGLAQTRPVFNTQQPFTQNLLRYLRASYNRGQENIRLSRGSDRLIQSFQPPAERWQRMNQYLQGVDPVVTDPIDQAAERYLPGQI